MAKQNQSIISALGDETFNRLSRLYLLALTFIALSAIGSQLLIQYFLQNQLGDAKVINIAGRQRMLSQKLTKEILLLAEQPQALTHQNNLIKTLQQWTIAHEGLQNGNDSLELAGTNSTVVRELFDHIQPYYQALQKQTQLLLTTDSISNKSTFVSKVLQNEKNFLEGMDRLVFQYEYEAKNRIRQLRITEFLLLALLISILALELFFIFRPAAKRVKKVVQNLSDSEQQAQSIASENKILFVEKEKSLRELQTMNFAMDSASLYASLTLSGQVIHLSEKFKNLVGVSQIPHNATFSELVTEQEGEQQYLNQLLSNPRSSIWTEELDITTKQGKKICLEISILPVNQEDVRQEILLLCNDLTIRKEAQLEIERLNQEKFDLEISQQKLMSLRVVEAQEEERKRIAKDMHDGIGQMLTALKFNLESVNIQKPEKAQAKLTDIKGLAGDLIKSVRVATFNLTPPELSDYGIGTGLAKLVEGLNKRTGKNILFENKTSFQIRFDTSTETNLYRITQEAINNAIKYAQANYILVTLSHSSHLLSIRIDDDGVGFDVEDHFSVGTHKDDGSGMGLAFMQERVKFINGRLFIQSEVGQGTRITINMPLEG